MDHPRKLVAELSGDLETIRVEVDLDISRVTVWVMRVDEDEPERYEVQMEQRS